MDAIVAQQLLEAGKKVEDQLDSEIQRLDKLASNEDDLETLRQRRLESMKTEAIKKQEWKSNGHGVYSELGDEKEFFAACKQSPRVVCHFYRPTTQRCLIVDRHLTLLAAQHVETRFIKMNAERCPFLAQRLSIIVIPTIAIVVEDKITDYIRGFDDLGGVDTFSTPMLEWRLAYGKAIFYTGDITSPPDMQQKKPSLLKTTTNRNVRAKKDDSDDSE